MMNNQPEHEIKDNIFVRFNNSITADEFQVPQGITVIGERAFENSKIRKLILPEGLKIIGSKAFCCFTCEYVIVPDSVEIIEESAFSGCIIEKGDLVLPPSLKQIGEYAFAFCEVRAIHFSLSVEKIGDFAFADSTASRLIYKGNCCVIIDGSGDRSELYETVKYIESYDTVLQEPVFTDIRNPEFKGILAALSLTDCLSQNEFEYLSSNYIQVLKYLMKNPENRSTLINTITFRPFTPSEYAEISRYAENVYHSYDYKTLLSDNTGAVQTASAISVQTEVKNIIQNQYDIHEDHQIHKVQSGSTDKNYVSGERSDITDCSYIEINFRSRAIPGGTEPDSYSFMLHQNGRAESDSDLIFFGLKTSADGSLTDQSDGTRYSVLFKPSLMSPGITRIVVCFSVYGDDMRMNFSRITDPYIEILSDVPGISGKHKLLLTSEKTIEAVEFYRHNGKIKMKIIGSGYYTGIKELCDRYGIETK